MDDEKEIIPEDMIFTIEDLVNCWNPNYHRQYFLDILNKEVSIDTAREDLYSLIGSK